MIKKIRNTAVISFPSGGIPICKNWETQIPNRISPTPSAILLLNRFIWASYCALSST